MKKKFVVVILSVVLGVSSLNGCGKADKGIAKNMEHNPENENAVYGEVSKVTENAITIKVGTRKEMKQPEGEPPEKLDGEQPEGMPEKPNGEQPEGMPEKPDGKQADDGEQPQGEPSKQADGERPQGELSKQADGEQRGERPAMLDLNGEEEEIAITQETVIKRQGEEISISDISEGDVVMIIPTEDEDAAEINVISGMSGGGRDMAPMDEESKKNDGTV